MDEYKVLHPSAEDLDLIVSSLKEFGSITFPYSDDHATCYVVYIGKVGKQLGTMPWGGSTHGTYFVGLRLMGCGNMFELNSEQELFPCYIEEKMQLSAPAADAMAFLLNELRKRFSLPKNR